METTLTELKTFNIADQVNYNDSRVEFAQLMKTPYGGVNLLAFRAGQQLAEHKAPAAVLINVVEGTINFVVADTPLTLHAGQAFLMEAGTPHRVEAVTDAKMMLVKVSN